MAGKKLDVPPGTRFGRLTVIAEGEPIGKRRVRSLRCSCDCGSTIRDYGLLNLRAGDTLSCGCLKKERISKAQTTHGNAKSNTQRTRLYRIWIGMKYRCTNPRSKSYENYGGRGIAVHQEWMDSFEAFKRDIGEPPSDLHTIERRDVNRGYEPGNCYWATMEEKANNRRTNVVLTLGGMSLTQAQWAKKLGIAAQTIRRRLQRGLPLAKVLQAKKTIV